VLTDSDADRQTLEDLEAAGAEVLVA